MSLYNNVWANSYPDFAPMSEVNKLRTDAQITVSELAKDAEVTFLSREDFNKYNEDLQKKLFTLNRDNKNIIKQLSSITSILNQKFDFIPNVNASQNQDDNASISTRREADNDVIMRNTIPNTLQEVPEPGFFTGDTKETDLFCQLCEDTFKTYPNCESTMDVKINYVKSRLRDGARNWYYAKYKDRSPATLEELIKELRKAFNNVASKKLAMIQLAKISHTFGKINDYIDEFRTLTTCLNWNEEALVLFFYNGLHPRFQEEIEKMDEFPSDLSTIYTRCILYENSLKSKGQLKSNGNKNLKKKPSNVHNNNNNNNNKYNNNNNYNKYYNNNYNKVHNNNNFNKINNNSNNSTNNNNSKN